MIGGASMGGGDFTEHVAIPGVASHEWRGRFFEFVTNEGKHYAIDPVHVAAFEHDGGERQTVIYLRSGESINVSSVDGVALWNVLNDRRQP